MIESSKNIHNEILVCTFRLKFLKFMRNLTKFRIMTNIRSQNIKIQLVSLIENIINDYNDVISTVKAKQISISDRVIASINKLFDEFIANIKNLIFVVNGNTCAYNIINNPFINTSINTPYFNLFIDKAPNLIQSIYNTRTMNITSMIIDNCIQEKNFSSNLIYNNTLNLISSKKFEVDMDNEFTCYLFSSQLTVPDIISNTNNAEINNSIIYQSFEKQNNGNESLLSNLDHKHNDSMNNSLIFGKVINRINELEYARKIALIVIKELNFSNTIYLYTASNYEKVIHKNINYPGKFARIIKFAPFIQHSILLADNMDKTNEEYKGTREFMKIMDTFIFTIRKLEYYNEILYKLVNSDIEPKHFIYIDILKLLNNFQKMILPYGVVNLNGKDPTNIQPLFLQVFAVICKLQYFLNSSPKLYPNIQADISPDLENSLFQKDKNQSNITNKDISLSTLNPPGSIISAANIMTQNLLKLKWNLIDINYNAIYNIISSRHISLDLGFRKLVQLHILKPYIKEKYFSFKLDPKRLSSLKEKNENYLPLVTLFLEESHNTFGGSYIQKLLELMMNKTYQISTANILCEKILKKKKQLGANMDKRYNFVLIQILFKAYLKSLMNYIIDSKIKFTYDGLIRLSNDINQLIKDIKKQFKEDNAHELETILLSDNNSQLNVIKDFIMDMSQMRKNTQQPIKMHKYHSIIEKLRAKDFGCLIESKDMFKTLFSINEFKSEQVGN